MAGLAPTTPNMLCAALEELQRRPAPPSTLSIELCVSCSPVGAWSLRALNTYLQLYSVTRGAACALRTFTRVTQQHGVEPDVQSYVAIMCTFGVDWQPEHAQHMQQLRADMRARALVLVVPNVVRLVERLRHQPAALQLIHRWAMEDGALLWLPAAVKKQLDQAKAP